MGAIASQITCLTIICSTVYSEADKKPSKLRVTGLCVGNSPGTGEFPHMWPVTLKMFPFDDVIMLTVYHMNAPITEPVRMENISVANHWRNTLLELRAQNSEIYSATSRTNEHTGSNAHHMIQFL